VAKERKVNEMKNKKFLIVLSILAVMLIGLASVSYAVGGFKTPAEVVAGLTGKSANDVIAQRQAGVSYGAQAKASGKLEQFQDERIAQYKAQLDALVTDGKMTRKEADDRIAAMTVRMASCDGEGTGLGNSLGQGSRNGSGNGLKDGSGAGLGMRSGGGMGRGGNGLNCTITK
jgi:hypothetical protein